MGNVSFFSLQMCTRQEAPCKHPMPTVQLPSLVKESTLLTNSHLGSELPCMHTTLTGTIVYFFGMNHART